MLKLLRDLTNFIFGLISILLVFRFALKLLGANSRAGFVNWIYETTAPLLGPFQIAFPAPKISGQFVLEFSTLFALLIYIFVGYMAQQLLGFFTKGK